MKKLIVIIVLGMGSWATASTPPTCEQALDQIVFRAKALEKAEVRLQAVRDQAASYPHTEINSPIYNEALKNYEAKIEDLQTAKEEALEFCQK